MQHKSADRMVTAEMEDNAGRARGKILQAIYSERRKNSTGNKRDGVTESQRQG